MNLLIDTQLPLVSYQRAACSLRLLKNCTCDRGDCMEINQLAIAATALIVTIVIAENILSQQS
jgi:hypothetical protein